MKKRVLSIILILVSIFCFLLWGCGPDGDEGPVANAELDEYNQIVSQMKEVFAENSSQAQPLSLTSKTPNASALFSSSNEDEISNMFAMMVADSSKKESSDSDYYAYGIDFSTMTARIAGYAANNFFRISSFYDVNILMDYGGNTVINTCVKKEENTIKTYLFTTFKNTKNEIFKEYNYAEINFTSQTDFDIVVVDYVYNEQNINTSKTMIYASSEKDFFLMSGDVDNVSTSILFFNKGESDSAYVIEGKNSNTINDLFEVMDESFALSSQDKNFIESLDGNERYSISFKQVTQAKKALGILIDLEDNEYVPPIGFVSNKNAEDLIGRKTLQAFIDDGKSVDGKTLTIPSEYNYLSGGIYFDADIDTLVIPSTIKGIVVYDRLWNYSILDDSLCYYDAGDNYEDGRYRPWGGSLISYVSGAEGYYTIEDLKPFKKYILLDDNGNQTKETDAFVLDELGNLWIKDSNGEKNYLWGLTSEPSNSSNTLYIPSPTFVNKDRYIQVDHFAGEIFLEAMRNVGKIDDYVAHFSHMVIEGYNIEEYNPETGVMPGFALVNSMFLKSHEDQNGNLIGCKWDLETLTINNITDGAKIDLTQVFCSESTSFNQFGIPSPKTICQTKIDKVILNGEFDTITYINGFCEISSSQLPGIKGGQGVMIPEGGMEITATYAISEDYELNGRENAHFSYESIVYGQKIVEIYKDESNFPSYPDMETLLIKSSVTELRLFNSLLNIGAYKLPDDRKITIEFENIAGIEFGMFYIDDLMNVDSTRVEKIKFNVSELYMENLIKNLEGNPNATWLGEIVNSNKFTVQFADLLNGEEEFLTNFTFENYGGISIKESSQLSKIEINDEFLVLAKQILGKELSQINIDFWEKYGTDLEIVVNVSKTFIDSNNGQFPTISGGTTIELASSMKEIGDLTAILDSIFPFDEAKLIFNGTKQELISCSGTLGADYLTRLLFVEYGNFDEIVFSDNEKLYSEIRDNVVTYEDERIKIEVVFSNLEPISFSFVDKLNENISFTNSNGENFGTDDENSWCVNIGCGYFNIENSTYKDSVVNIPIYHFSIYYQYGQEENGDFNYIYGTYENHLIVEFKLHMLPSNIQIA